jgi:hypothetical protein
LEGGAEGFNGSNANGIGFGPDAQAEKHKMDNTDHLFIKKS